MRVRPTWKAPTAKQAANFVSDFDRPSFGTLRDEDRSETEEPIPHFRFMHQRHTTGAIFFARDQVYY